MTVSGCSVMTEENHNLFNGDFDILNEDFDFDEEYSDDEAIQLVDQLNEKAGISNAFLSEISDCIFSAPTINVIPKSLETENKKRERDDAESKEANLVQLVEIPFREAASVNCYSIDSNYIINPNSSSFPTPPVMTASGGIHQPPPVAVPNTSGGNGNDKHPPMSNGTASSVLTAPKVRRTKSSMAKKKKQLPAAKPPPPPISKFDPRRTFARMILNTFNSCDTTRLIDVFNGYCTEEMIAIHRYDGVKNPYGRDWSQVTGRNANIQLWTQLFKSAPDFFYDVLDANAYYSPDWKVMVSSRFQWSGTRIADIRVARATNERVLQRKLFESSKYVTDEKELLKQLVLEKQEVIQDVSLFGGENKSDTSIFVEQDESYFHTQKNSLIATEEDQFYLDSNPLPQRQHMQCVGTLYLELNEDRKIVKMEFVFTALSEKKLMMEAKESGDESASSSKAGGESPSSQNTTKLP